MKNEGSVPEELRPAADDTDAVKMTKAVMAVHSQHLRMERDRQFWGRIRFASIVVPFLVIGIVFVAKQAKSLAGWDRPAEYVAAVDITGAISNQGSRSGRQLAGAMVKAMRDEHAKGLVIRVNSGGGAAMQSAMVRDALDRERRERPDFRVIAIAEDVMASGAYLIASGADRIYVHPMTMTGSIGAVIEGWGFEGLMDRVGVERRTFAAGEHKVRLSPYRGIDPGDEVWVSGLVDEIHELFIEYVRIARGERLNGSEDKLYSGDVWLGREALELGLVDGHGNMIDILQMEFGTETLKNYTPKQSWLERGPALLSALASWVGTDF